MSKQGIFTAQIFAMSYGTIYQINVTLEEGDIFTHSKGKLLLGVL